MKGVGLRLKGARTLIYTEKQINRKVGEVKLKGGVVDMGEWCGGSAPVRNEGGVGEQLPTKRWS